MGAFEIVQQFSNMLTNLDSWLQAGAEHATAKGFDVNVLAQARLAPDQYNLVQQVQSACDQAKYAAAYLTGTKPPAHPDTETTVDQLRERIKSAKSFVDDLKESAYANADTVRVAPPWMGGKSVHGKGYLMRISIPNFYFHVTTAYAILRHNGVVLGKGDYIGVKDFSELGAE
jgi:hypothetical protein